MWFEEISFRSFPGMLKSVGGTTAVVAAVAETDQNNMSPSYPGWLNYFSLPLIPASDTTLLILTDLLQSAKKQIFLLQCNGSLSSSEIVAYKGTHLVDWNITPMYEDIFTSFNLYYTLRYVVFVILVLSETWHVCFRRHFQNNVYSLILKNEPNALSYTM